MVGIGASAGGLEALEKLFSAMPADSGLSFVVVQHLERSHPSRLAELLAKHTRMPVAQAADGALPEPDHVYVIAPNTVLTLERGALRVSPAGEASARVDDLFRSLAGDRGERAIGVLLSGTGSDGTAGLREIRRHGGFGVAQDPRTAKHGAMPRSAIEAGLVDEVLDLERIPGALVAHAHHLSAVGRAAAADLDADVARRLAAICAIVHERTGHDFSGYKEPTLVRRIRRRIHVRLADSASHYLEVLRHDPDEPQRLLKDLLIGVTQFFRDPDTFERIAARVLPRILDGKPPDTPLRIWVPGCASGEEVYSIAIVVHERLAEEEGRRPVQIFGTDIDAGTIAEARAGRYPSDIEEHVSPERLERYFVRAGTGWKIGKDLRDMCIFSAHSLIRDPPFSTLDLISCRNVLIYLEPDLQRKVIPLFHYALRRGGHLVLGPAEGLVHHPDLFEVVDAKRRIYRRVDTLARQVDLAALARAGPRGIEPPAPAPTPQQRVTAAIERMIVDEYAPPCAVVNARGDIQFMAGRIGRFLAPPAGAPPTNVLDAVRDSLRLELRGALRTAAEGGARVVRDGVPVELEDGVRRVRLTVRRVPGAEGLFAIVLQDRGADDAAAEEPAVTPVPPALEQIEAELRTTRADLRSAVEGAEIANEELRSANEELVSTNEELQAANEELQTSKEELQSLNEELETVNAELRRSVEDLATANADLQNLFASTEIATIFLDGDLRITRFTPAATALFRLLPGDVGRAIADFAPRFEGDHLDDDAGTVLGTGKPTERHVRSADGSAWFILRVLPYRDAEDRVVGVVVTFVDVTELKRAEARLAYVASFPEKNPNPIVEADVEGRVRYANPAAERLFPDIRARGGAHPWLADWAEAARSVRERGGPGTRVVTAGDRTYHQVLVYAPEERVMRSYGIDITDRVRAEAERERALAEVKLRAAELDASFSAMANGVMVYGRDGTVLRMNRTAEELLGRTQREWAGVEIHERALQMPAQTLAGRPIPLEDAPTFRALRGETLHGVQMVLQIAPGQTRTVLVSAAPIRAADGEIHGAVTAFADTTELRRAQQALRESEQKYAAIHDHAPFAIALTAPDGTLASVNDEFTRLFGYARDEVVGKTSVDLGIADPASRARVNAELQQRGAVRDLEVVRRTRSGEARVVSLNIDPVIIGGETFTLTTSRDVTARRRAEEALERSREGLSRLAEASLRVVRETDLAAMLQAVSEAALALTGARLATAGHGYVGGRFLVGGSARAPGAPACPPGDMFEVKRGGVHLDLVDGAEAIRLDDAAVRAHPRWWGLPPEHVPMRGLLGVRMVGRNGQTSGMILVTDKVEGEFGEEDESLLRQLATIASLALQHVEARISLEAADRSKNDFLAMLSHELRNPLAPIRNSLYILDRTAPGGEQARKAQAVIERQTGHLTRLVDDLLDVTRISRNKIQLQLESLDLADVVRRAAEDHRASFANGGVALEVSVPERPLVAVGDRTRLTQVVGNLLENALKFTPRGGRTEVSLEANGDVRQAVLRVRDTGAGIAAEMLPRLFQPFTQADRTLDRSKGGLGLGLALVRGLVEMHRGTVTAESPGLGEGTELTVRLPLGAGAPAAPRPRDDAVAGRRRVLVIEDNVDAAESLRDALVLGGHSVDVAFSGAEGISKARGFAPDVVFCDIGLPGMDGYEVARAIRTDGALRGVRLVALTGYAAPDDVARAKASGFDAHVPKPPTLEALERSMSS